MTDKISIVLAEEQALVRAGIKAVLENDENIEIVGEAIDGIECLELIRAYKPKVVVLDLSLPRLTGIGVISHIHKRYADTKVFVLSDASMGSVWQEAFELGINGAAMKNISVNGLLAAVHQVAEGEDYIDPAVQAIIDSADLENKKVLSIREKQVVKLVAEGYKTKAIAELLEISDRTVSKHRENLMTKMGATSTAELTNYANQSGLTKVELSEIE
ncbi:response regulator transcription factor [Thiomicrorhabdus sp.]|uniref:response regulator transcription factor n=1 Tax=Thiomicrorhabdus sp. TaxID=2039724 RepID=UPI0029C8D6E2|nr:response regulator transcription factor [Thiomicrorhabdus sp.]